MPRLFVQHVAVIGASLVFAFFRPASALDISVPRVSVPRVSVPRVSVPVPHVGVPHVNIPQVNAPRPGNPATSRIRAMSTQRGTTTVLEGGVGSQGHIRAAGHSSLGGSSSRTPNNLSSADTYSIGVGCREPARTCR